MIQKICHRQKIIEKKGKKGRFYAVKGRTNFVAEAIARC